jgi:hypothetical protein
LTLENKARSEKSGRKDDICRKSSGIQRTAVLERTGGTIVVVGDEVVDEVRFDIAKIL